MTPCLIFRIIGWFLIGVLVLSGVLNILSIGKPRKKEPIDAETVLVTLSLNFLTIWFIYTAMQI